MKLRNFLEAFDVITEVYNSLQDSVGYKRKLELAKPYAELKSIIDWFDEEKKKIFYRYGDSNGQIKDENSELANNEFNKLLNTDVNVPTNLRFNQQEIENCNIQWSDLAKIIDFIEEAYQDSQ